MTAGQKKRFTAALLIAMVFLSFVNLMGGVILSHLIDHYQLRDAAQGYNGTAGSLGGIFALISSFFVMGRAPKKYLLAVAIGVCIIALALMRAASPSFGMFLAACVILGMSIGYMDSLLSSNMADLYQGKQGAKMMGVLHTTFSVSAVLVPMVYAGILSGFVGRGIAWNNLFLCIAALGVVALILYLVSVPRGIHTTASTTSTAHDEKITFAIIRKRLLHGVLPGLIIAMMLHNLFFTGIGTWINRYVSVTLGSSLGDMALSFLWLGIMLSRILIPSLPLKTETYLCIAGFLTGGVVILGVLIGNAVVMCVATVLAGFFFGAMLTGMLNVGCEATPENTMLATTSLGLAMSIGSMVAGPLVGALESAFTLDVGIAVIALFIVLSSIVLMVTPGVGREKKEKKYEYSET